MVAWLRGLLVKLRLSTKIRQAGGSYTPSLTALDFSSHSFLVGVSSSGTIIGANGGSTITASGLPAGLTINGAARTWSWDGTGSVSSGTFTLTETLAGATGSPKVSTISFAISNQPTLGALAFSPSLSLTTGTPASGTITGATTGSTLSMTGQPTGLTINSGARTWAYDGTGSASSGTLTLTETLASATNSPNPNSIGFTVSDGSAVLDNSIAAPTLSLAVPATTYPPQLNLGLPADYIVGTHSIHFQGDDDYLFGSTFIDQVLSPNDTQAQAQTYIDSALASIASGVNFFRARIEWVSGGVTHYTNWSNTQGHGDATAPTISSSATQSGNELAPMAFSVTASEVCTYAIGGTDASLLELSSSSPGTSVTVRLVGNANLNYEGKSSYSFTITATDLSGNASAPQSCTFNVNDLDEVPNALSFTPQTNATLGATYTSNTVTIAGLGASITANVSVSGGTWSKNGGAFSSASGSVVNGDTITLQGTAPGTDGLTTTVSLTIGDPAATYTYKILTPGAGVGITMASPVPNAVSGTSGQLFTSITFVAGIPLVAYAGGIQPNNVQIKSGATVVSTLTKVAESPDHSYQIWTGPAISAGTYDVLCDGISTSVVKIICASLLRVNPTPTATSAANQTTHTTPWQVPGTFTISSGVDIVITLASGQLSGLTFNSSQAFPCTLNGTTTVVTASTATLFPGMPVSGTNIPAGATIASITNGTTFLLSAAATGSGSSTLTFINGVFSESFSYFLGDHTSTGTVQPGFTGSGNLAVGLCAAQFTAA